MARAKGQQALVAWKKGTTWDTAVAGGALDGIYVKSISFPEGGTELIENMQISGAEATQRPPTLGDKRYSGIIVADLPYEGLDTLIAQVFGTAGAPATVDTTAKQHVYKMKQDLDGIFGTLAYEILKDTTIYEAPSMKLHGLTLRGKANQNVEVELRGIASNFTDSSAVNTTTTIDTVTVPANSQYLAPFSHITFQMNAQTGGALGAYPTDGYYIAEFELSIDRTMEGLVTTRYGNKIDEPHQNGFAKVTLRLTFAHLQNDSPGGNLALVADQIAGTEKKAKLLLTSTVLAGAVTQKFQHVYWLPRIVALPDGKPKLIGPGNIGWSQSFNCYHVTTVPTGFTAGYVNAVVADVFNQRATDALA